MSDLLSKLRNATKNPIQFDSVGWSAATCGLVTSAADHIEHLENLLQVAKTALESHTQQTRPIYATNQVISLLENPNPQGKENDQSKL